MSKIHTPDFNNSSLTNNTDIKIGNCQNQLAMTDCSNVGHPSRIADVS